MTSNSSSVVLFHPSTSIPQRPITLQRYTRKYQARTNNLHPHRCPHLTRESSRLVLSSDSSDFSCVFGGMMHPSTPPHVSALATNSWPASASRADLFPSAKKGCRICMRLVFPGFLFVYGPLPGTVSGSLYSSQFAMVLLVLCDALARPIKRWRRRRSGRVLEGDGGFCSRCSFFFLLLFSLLRHVFLFV